VNRRGFLGSVAALCAMPAAVKATEARQAKAIELFNREAVKPFELRSIWPQVGEEWEGGKVTSVVYNQALTSLEVTCIFEGPRPFQWGRFTYLVVTSVLVPQTSSWERWRDEDVSFCYATGRIYPNR